VLRLKGRPFSVSGTTEESALIKLHLKCQLWKEAIQEWLKAQPKMFYSDRKRKAWTLKLNALKNRAIM
jgi:hypothetical protein